MPNFISKVNSKEKLPKLFTLTHTQTTWDLTTKNLSLCSHLKISFKFLSQCCIFFLQLLEALPASAYSHTTTMVLLLGYANKLQKPSVHFHEMLVIIQEKKGPLRKC